MGRITLACLTAAILAGVSASPSTVLAQPKPDANDVAEAKRYFEMGLKLYKEKRFNEALAAFKEAKLRQARPSILKNLAQCYRELGDFASAHAAFSDWLDRYAADKTVKPKEVEEIKHAISDLLVLTGTLKLTVSDADAIITLSPSSGEERDLGKSPMTEPVRLNLGTYKITISKTGFDKFTRQIEIRAREELVIEATLKREYTSGSAKVTTTGDDPSARLLIDGQEVGALPWSGDLTPGTHKLTIRAEKTKATPQEVKVAPGAQLAITFDLLAQSGKVVIDTRNADAEIYVDDKRVSKGAWEGSLSIGRHEIELRLDGYEPYRRVVLIHNDEVIDLGQIPWIKKVKEDEGPPPFDYKGGYFQVVGLGTFGVGTPTNEIAKSCPSQAITPPLTVGATCDASHPLGGGLLFRGGYSFGILGLEGFAFGSFDRSTASARYDNGSHVDDPNNVIVDDTHGHGGVSRNEKYTFYRYGGGLGAGARITSQHPRIRLTFGLGGGLTQRWMKYERASAALYQNQDRTTSSEKFTSDATSYTAPLLALDGGLLVGGSPGVKFVLGVQMLFEFAPSTTVDALPNRKLGVAQASNEPLGTPKLQVAKGAQIFIGPTLGFQFGT